MGIEGQDVSRWRVLRLLTQIPTVQDEEEKAREGEVKKPKEKGKKNKKKKKQERGDTPLVRIF